MIAGIDFPDEFAQYPCAHCRAWAYRHERVCRHCGTARPKSAEDRPGDNHLGSGGLNPWNPESLYTGAEFAEERTGPREWPDVETYLRAVRGQLPVAEVPRIAPRTAPRTASIPVLRPIGAHVRPLASYSDLRAVLELE